VFITYGVTVEVHDAVHKLDLEDSIDLSLVQRLATTKMLDEATYDIVYGGADFEVEPISDEPSVPTQTSDGE
jgi:hypothetical protein